MKKEVIETVEVRHIPYAFSKIGTKQRPELLLIGRINQLQLVEAIENFRS
jgi:hypothetical protein